MIEIEGKTYPVQEYFLEDIIQLVQFQGDHSLTNQRKSNNKQRLNFDDDDDDFGDEDSQGDETEVYSDGIVSHFD